MQPVYLSIRIKTSQGILTYCSCDTHAQNSRVEHANSTSSSISLNVNNNNLSNNINNNITSQHHHHLHSSSSESVSQLISSRINNNNNDANSNNNRISLPNDLTTTVSTATLTSHRSSTSLLDPVDPNRCSHCFEHIQFLFDEILSELEIPYADEEFLEPTPLKETKVTPARPSVRISVFDTESNANVCMCSLYSSSFSLGGKSVAEATPEGDQAQICPNCRNIIKHQPVEHRKTLVSRRLMLANDIIVNRIDTHYLNTYTSPSGLTSGAAGPGTSGAQFEPYTPESVESHSPVPETIDRMDFDETQVEEPLLTPLPETAPEVPPAEPPIIPPAVTKKPATSTTTNNNNNSMTTTGTSTGCGGGVSPRQLKSRLEKLKRISDRQKTYAKTCERLNNSVVGEEVPLAEPGKLTSQGGGEGRPASDSERNDRKLVDCCRRHCCAIQ